MRTTPNLNDALFLHLHLFSRTKPKSQKSLPRLVSLEKHSILAERNKILSRAHKSGYRFEGSLERGCLLYHHSCIGGLNFAEKKVNIVDIGFDPG